MSQGEWDDLAAELGLPLLQEQARVLSRYLDLLQRWNVTYNLTAVRDREAMRVQHIADCLAAIPSLRRRMTGARLLDVGSGGGLPGIVVATLMPHVQVTCVDAVGKKAAFLRQAASELALPNLHALHARVELLAGLTFDVIASRAFASLSDFTSLTRSLLAGDGQWMAMKGQRPDQEIAGLPSEVDAFHVEQLEVPGLNAQRCLVWLRPRPVPPAN